MNVLAFVGLCLLPVAVFELCLKGAALWRWVAARTHRPDRGAPVDYGEQLRRLAADHDQLLNARIPAKAARLRALRLAYDDTLRDACAVLDVEAPPAPWDAATRVQLEADLVTHGLTW